MIWKFDKIFKKVVFLFKTSNFNILINNSEDFFSINLAIFIAKFVFIKNFKVFNNKFIEYCKNIKSFKGNIKILTTKELYNSLDLDIKKYVFLPKLGKNIGFKYFSNFLDNFKNKKTVVIIYRFLNFSSSPLYIKRNKYHKYIFMKNTRDFFCFYDFLVLNISIRDKNKFLFENCYLPEIFYFYKKNTFLQKSIFDFLVKNLFIKKYFFYKYYNYILIFLEKIVNNFFLRTYGVNFLNINNPKKHKIRKIIKIFKILLFLYKNNNIINSYLLFKIRKLLVS